MIPDNEVRLTQMTKTAGCAAKIGPGTLAGVLENLPKAEDPNLLVGIETSDDGAVYRVNDELAFIQTLDFFTPVVDDPYTFGQVAAANALSDIYAMGGEPKVALNIVAWPNCVNPAFLGKILEGGASKVAEAGAVLAGGHSVQETRRCADSDETTGNRYRQYGGEGGYGFRGGEGGGDPGYDLLKQDGQARDRTV